MRLHLHLISSIIVLVLVIAGGSFFYQQIEGWNKIDSTYFVVVTMTTIGYGDLVPQTDIGKIFTMFFSFFGVAMAFYFLSLIGSMVFDKRLKHRVGQIEASIKQHEKKKKELRKIVVKKKKS
jgi:voltage-gated potassium channel